MDDDYELNDVACTCSECGDEVYDLEYLDPPTCKQCARDLEIARESDQ